MRAPPASPRHHVSQMGRPAPIRRIRRASDHSARGAHGRAAEPRGAANLSVFPGARSGTSSGESVHEVTSDQRLDVLPSAMPRRGGDGAGRCEVHQGADTNTPARCGSPGQQGRQGGACGRPHGHSLGCAKANVSQPWPSRHTPPRRRWPASRDRRNEATTSCKGLPWAAGGERRPAGNRRRSLSAEARSDHHLGRPLETSSVWGHAPFGPW
jgi:hypothetical protein